MGNIEGHANSTVLINSDIDPYLKDVKFILRDKNHEMVSSWNAIFKNDAKKFIDEKYIEHFSQQFEISEGDIFGKGETLIHADSIVSPANSFGFMDGGIDMRFSERFGWQLMERLQVVIKSDEFFGEILVGQAVIIEAKDPEKTITYLISAPTMRVPLDVRKTANAYLAFKAVLMEVRKHNMLVSQKKKEGSIIKSVLCPGLGTMVGMMSFTTCAIQMIEAYRTVVLGRVFPYDNLSQYSNAHSRIILELNATKHSLPPRREPKSETVTKIENLQEKDISLDDEDSEEEK